MFNASDRTKYTSLEPVHIFLLKNAAFLSPKQHNSEYPSFRLRCSHAGPPERASGPRLCSHCRAIFFSKNGFTVITEETAGGRLRREAAPGASHSAFAAAPPHPTEVPSLPSRVGLARAGSCPGARREPTPGVPAADAGLTHQPRLRDLRQGHLGRGRQAARRLLPRSMVSDLQTCRDQPHHGGDETGKTVPPRTPRRHLLPLVLPMVLQGTNLLRFTGEDSAAEDKG